MDTRTFFDSVVCINLSRRPDRWTTFTQRMSEMNNPVGTVQRFEAVDGERVPAPRWFRVGEASYTWGCMMSHLRIWETMINNNVESVLIFEDDAVLCDTFSSALSTFLAHLPKTWDMLWIGGDHVPQSIPTQINPHVYRPEACWRTHCYALSRSGMLQLYKDVCRFNEAGRFPKPADYHIDHQMAAFMRNKECRAYCPPSWLVGQISDFSDVAQSVRHSATAFYNDVNPIRAGRFRCMP